MEIIRNKVSVCLSLLKLRLTSHDKMELPTQNLLLNFNGAESDIVEEGACDLQLLPS